MTDLKNCPFCGGEDVEHLPDGFGNWLVGCVTCDYRIQCVSCTEDEAIRYWNTRPAEDALKAENEELCSTISGMKKTIGRAEKVLGERNLLAAEVERLKAEITRYRRALHNLKEDCQKRLHWKNSCLEGLFLHEAITHIDAELDFAPDNNVGRMEEHKQKCE